MDFKLFKLEIKRVIFVLLKIIIFCVEVQPKDVYFTEPDCGGYRHYLDSASETYQIVWNGEPYPAYCSLRFSNYEGIDHEWQICAEITELDLECGGPEVSYHFINDKQRFTCISQLPVDRYCDNSVIFVELYPYKKGRTSKSNSRLRITISREKKPNLKSESSDLYVLAYVLPLTLGFLIFSVTLTICLYRKRQRQMRGFGGVVVRRRGDMVLMAVPADRATELLTHTPNTHGALSVPERRYQDSGNQQLQWQYHQQTQGQPEGASQELLQDYRPLQNTDVNAPPSYNKVVNKTMY